MILTFVSVDEILKCDHSNESYLTILPCETVFTLHKVLLTFQYVDEILKCDHSKDIWGPYVEQYSPVVLFNILYKVVLTFVSVADV